MIKISEDKFFEVWIDDKTELWDEYIPPQIAEKIALSKLLYIRKGECKRCGSCCSYIDKEGKKQPCKYLSFDKDGLAICSIYETRPNRCRDFPPKPDVTHKHPECGYYFEIDTSLKYDTAIARLDDMCAICIFDKANCLQRAKNEKDINLSCVWW